MSILQERDSSISADSVYRLAKAFFGVDRAELDFVICRIPFTRMCCFARTARESLGSLFPPCDCAELSEF